MSGLKRMFSSTRATLAIMLVIACTALVLTGRMTAEQWVDYTKVLAAAVIAGETVRPSKRPEPAIPPARVA